MTGDTFLKNAASNRILDLYFNNGLEHKGNTKSFNF